MEKEDWVGSYPRWMNADERQLIKLYYADVPIEEIGKTLNRDGMQVTLRLVELRILGTDSLAMVWNDYSESAKAS